MAWYAIYTKSRSEKKLSSQLTSQGIENYLPLKRELRKWSDRNKWVEVPAINCYLFVNIELNQKELLFKQSHFVSFVRSFGSPAIIPEYQMDIMRKAIGSVDQLSIEATTLTIGQRIKLLTPPLEGVEGVITRTSGKGKIYICIENSGISLVLDSDKINFELTEI